MKFYVGSKLGDYELDGFVWFLGRKNFDSLEEAIEYTKKIVSSTQYEYTIDLNSNCVLDTVNEESFTNQPNEYPTVLVAQKPDKYTIVIGAEYN